jgi:hypothetical protein
LEQTAPDTEHRGHMKNLINFVIERNSWWKPSYTTTL